MDPKEPEADKVVRLDGSEVIIDRVGAVDFVYTSHAGRKRIIENFGAMIDKSETDGQSSPKRD